MKERQLSHQSRRELVEAWRERYLRAGRKEKTRIADELVALTGFHRKHALRVLRHGYRLGRSGRGRPRKYTGASVSALVSVWRICGELCGKLLGPFLPEVVPVLERWGELTLDEETRRLLLAMSPATIDRKLRPFRQPFGRGLSTTKPGTLLKQSVPVRTFADWEDAQPGFVEMDLVAHCGETTEGQYLHTLTATDVVTGWTECFVLLQRSQIAVSASLDEVRQRLPFPLLGIDCDNDSAFINGTLIRYCREHQIAFTRSRPWKKNDQAFVEQKNGAVVRDTIGYRRYTSPQAAALLAAIYADLHAYVNFFQPVRKLLFKERRGSRLYKKYDPASTPHRRALASEEVRALAKERLAREYQALNPAGLRRCIDEKLRRLRQLPE
jgi:hypothetical protein